MSVFSSSLRSPSVVMPPNASVCSSARSNNAMSRRLTSNQANPSLLGLLGFLIPYTSTILTLCQFQGAVPPYSLVGLTADYYFLGSIAMVIAGIGEFILGNSEPSLQGRTYYCEILTSVQPSHSLCSSSMAPTGAPWHTTKTQFIKSHRHSLTKAARRVPRTIRHKASTTSLCTLLVPPKLQRFSLLIL